MESAPTRTSPRARLPSENSAVIPSASSLEPPATSPELDVFSAERLEQGVLPTAI
jgi:hypothetical protein